MYYTQPTDMRKSYNTLSGIVTDVLGCDPCDGSVYIFMNRARNRIKLLHWEPGGMVIYSKLLEAGTFGQPAMSSKDELAGTIEWRDLVLIVEGIVEKKRRSKTTSGRVEKSCGNSEEKPPLTCVYH